MADTFLRNVDTQVVDALLKETDENTKYFNSVSESVVKQYTQQLDSLMKDIYNDIVLDDSPSLDVVEKYFSKLAATLYFMGEKLEQLGIRDDMSKSAAKEVYNRAYLDSQNIETSKKLTVAELTAKAEGSSVYETVVNSIYARSYKQVKYKIDAANEMMKTLSKIMSKRMAEMQLTQVATKYNVEGEDVL